MAETTATSPPPENVSRSTTAKRQRDDGDESNPEINAAEAQPTKRRVVLEQDILFRILVPSRQIGIVIGKAGARIQKIRDETRATIKIADSISRNEERVIIISSKDSESMYCDAENALHQIANLILKDERNNTEAMKAGTGHVAANTLRLLISGCQAGGVIGVSGQNIENLRNSSGATITILSPNQLPLCASAHESDRVIQMSGDIPAVLRALIEIGCRLRENPPKQIISINPTHNPGFRRPPKQRHVDPNSAEYVTLDMAIPENFMGGLIGRCGSNISRIRTESGATIKVHGGKGEQKQRQIQLGGSAQQVTLAKQRVDEYIYSQMIQAGGGQPPVSPSPAYGSIHNAAMMAAQPPMYYPPATHQAPPPPPPPYYAPQFHPPPNMGFNQGNYPYGH